MRRNFVSVFILTMAALAGAPWHIAHAQDNGVTVMGGYQFGGDFEDEVSGDKIKIDEASNVTLLFNLPYEQDTDFEFLISRQETALLETDGFTADKAFDLDIYYFHVGGMGLVSRGRVEPYLTGSLGFTHMTPGRSGLSSETRFSLSIGGGVRIPVTDRFGLRFDVRGFLTMFDGSSSIFCADGNCSVKIASDAFGQVSANAGMEYRF